MSLMDLSVFREDLFWLFPIGANLVSLGAFVFFAVPMTWLAWRRPAWAEKYRVQKKPSLIVATLPAALRTWAVNNLALLASIVLFWPLLRQSGIHWGPLPRWSEVFWQVLVFILIDDVLYFFFHRAMHSRLLYKRFHLKHHTIAVPYAAMGQYMSVTEFLATAGVSLVGPLVLGVHLFTLWAWVVFRQFETAHEHSGFDFSWSPARLFPGYKGVAFHDFHHSQFVGNYSGFIGLAEHVLTRLGFTRLGPLYAKGYREYLSRRTDL